MCRTKSPVWQVLHLAGTPYSWELKTPMVVIWKCENLNERAKLRLLDATLFPVHHRDAIFDLEGSKTSDVSFCRSVIPKISAQSLTFSFNQLQQTHNAACWIISSDLFCRFHFSRLFRTPILQFRARISCQRLTGSSEIGRCAPRTQSKSAEAFGRKNGEKRYELGPEKEYKE